MKKTRASVVNLVNSWVGKNEADGSYKSIIDIYNSMESFPRGIRMQYSWAWCACTWSALAIKLGYMDIMPVEMSCYYLIEKAKDMGIWQENDAYVPKPGDAVLYDWDDNGIGDNKGTPEHVGTVTEVYPEAGTFVVTEGNYKDSVKKRTMSINGRYIRGFITPKYDEEGTYEQKPSGNKNIDTVAREVISGKWGNGEVRKKKLAAAGYDYAKVRARVNEILNGSAVDVSKTEEPESSKASLTATDKAACFNKGLAGTYKVAASDFLYMRNGAGTNKKALCKLPGGTKVQNFGYYTVFNGTKWLLVQAKIGGVIYEGFSSEGYLKKC